MNRPPKVAILYFDAGSGHRSAAEGLAVALSQARPSWRISPVNLVELLRYNRLQQLILRFAIGQFNHAMKRERIPDYGRVIRGSCFMRDRLDRRAMRRFWADFAPDVLVSVTPLYHPPVFRSARQANPGVRCVTVPVDFAEPFDDCWFTPTVDQLCLLATDELERQACAAGIRPAARRRIGGMPIDPRFYTRPAADRPAELRRLSLDPDRPTGLVHFGGQGHLVMSEIARQLAAVERTPNVVFLCGRDRTVFGRLRQVPTPYPKLVLPFDPEPPVRYLALSDFVVGKPGSMTITEAIVTGVPMIALQSRALATVQRANEAWLTASGAGIVIPDASALPAAVATVLCTESYRASAARAAHRGVFDATDAIVELVEGDRATGAPRV